MLNTWVFMIFVICSVFIFWVIPARFRPGFLALTSASYFFCYYPKEIIFIFCLAVLVYAAGVCLDRKVIPTRPLMIGSVIFLVGVLTYFKYSGFILDNIRPLLEPLLQTKISLPKIFIPIGISYFTFKMIHYVIDTSRGQIEKHNVIDFLSYIFFYPILVSGPIERFQPFLKQIKESSSFKWQYVDDGLPRIMSGLFKKMVLADTLGATAALMQQPDLLAWQYWLASVAYTLQLYFDFSGYSDMAVGISKLFGIRVLENFNWPYLSPNLSDFWKRWHMSLTGWFRDYLFIPLGGSRGTLPFIIKNTLIVWAVTGLWHGAGWHFIFWGLFHAMGLIILRLYRKYLLPHITARTDVLSSAPARAFGVLLTFAYVNIGWIFFACDAQQSIYVISHMF